MAITLLDDTLEVKIFYAADDSDLLDNICICFNEDCPDEERLFRNEQTQIYLTAKEARALAEALLQAADDSLPQGM